SRMRALEITTLAAQDLSDVLLRAEQDGALPEPTVRMSLVETVRACASLVAAPTDDGETANKIEHAVEALDESVVQVNRHPDPAGTPDYSLAYAYAAIVCARHIVDACRDFVAATAEGASEHPSGE